VLKPGGRCVIVSYGSPDTRLSVLQQQGLDWKVLPVVSIPKPSIRCVCVCVCTCVYVCVSVHMHVHT
jgi:hypothetical protein